MNKILFLLFLILPIISYAAQCNVNGKWYPYSHPMCSGGSSNSSNTTNSTKQWFVGGNLHKATIAAWRSASYQNKLATAGDWLSSTKWKGHLNSPQDFDNLKKKSRMLVNAVDEASKADKKGVMKAREVAAAIITMANDLGP